VELTDVPPVPGVEHRMVAVNDVRLHVAEAGAGPPLILLHGWPQHWWCWRHVVPGLAADHRLLAPDLRGLGWSDAPRDDYAKSTFAADILALMDAEGLDRVSLLGHDWGGYTSFLLALEHPQRIERIVALDVTPPWLGRLRPRHLAAPLLGSYQALLAAPVLGPATMTSGNGFIRRIIRAGSGPAMHWSDDELDVYAGVLRDPRRATATSECYRSFLTRELPASLVGGHSPNDLDVPALLVMGEDSPIRRVLDPQPSRNLRVETVNAAGHFLPEEAPEQVIELTLEHLAGA
jgi:pimeloyl-ACP methyl ester carboxylesterase